MRFLSLTLTLLALAAEQNHAFLPRARNGNGVHTALNAMADLTFSKPDTAGILEEACREAADRMERVAVPVPSNICSSGSVGISYINFKPTQTPKRGSLPLILIHGFDSSALEYRRLGPRLAAKGIDTYAVDLLGWGFTQQDDVSSFSAQAKIDALKSFVDTMFGQDAKFFIAGASLGGAAAIELASAKQDSCEGLILLDAQGFVDGVGLMSMLPGPVAKIGVNVLRSVPLRNSANQMSYFDKGTFATEEAQVIGRLHCLRDGWSDAMVSFMQSGGFSPSAKVPTIQSPSLILWGRQDGILDGKEFGTKVSTMMILMRSDYQQFVVLPAWFSHVCVKTVCGDSSQRPTPVDRRVRACAAS
jgi:pimeloyl-ACP methyl ester carboxylesterase